MDECERDRWCRSCCIGQILRLLPNSPQDGLLDPFHVKQGKLGDIYGLLSEVDVIGISRPKPTALPSHESGEVDVGPKNTVFQSGWWLLDGRAVGLGGDPRSSMRRSVLPPKHHFNGLT